MQEKLIKGLLVRRSIAFPNYGVSRCGRAFRWDSEKEMATGLMSGRKEYVCFRVCHENKPSWAFLHKVLAECWIVNDCPVSKTQVNHIDGNKQNNCISNLEWVTPSQNQRHAVDTGLKGKGNQLYNSELSDDQVHLICQELQQGCRPKDIADKYETTACIVRKIRDGSTYFHIRRMYPINHSYKNDFSESTVRWVCERIIEGVSDKGIRDLSKNSNLTIIDVKRIRNKIRYSCISNEYF